MVQPINQMADWLILHLSIQKIIVIDATTIGYLSRLPRNLALSVLPAKPAIGQNSCSYGVYTVMPSLKVRRCAIKFLVRVNSIILTNSFLFAQIAGVRNGVLQRMLVLMPCVLPAPVEERFYG